MDSSHFTLLSWEDVEFHCSFSLFCFVPPARTFPPAVSAKFCGNSHRPISFCLNRASPAAASPFIIQSSHHISQPPHIPCSKLGLVCVCVFSSVTGELGFAAVRDGALHSGAPAVGGLADACDNACDENNDDNYDANGDESGGDGHSG